jgi:hypothetical protein
MTWHESYMTRRRWTWHCRCRLCLTWKGFYRRNYDGMFIY